MKKIKFILVVLCALLAYSCSETNSLTVKKATELISELPIFKEGATTTLDLTEHYISAKDSVKFKALQDAGMIQYTIKKEVTQSYYFSSANYLINITLTEEGKKFLVSTSENGVGTFITHKFKLNNVYNIFVLEVNNIGECNYDVSITEQSPFGKILTKDEADKTYTRQEKFIKYIDKGWVIK